VLACTLAGFALSSADGVNPAWAALAGAAVLAACPGPAPHHTRCHRQSRERPLPCLRAGLLGRGRGGLSLDPPGSFQPGAGPPEALGGGPEEFLSAAARSSRQVPGSRPGRAADGADLLILARDGDRTRLGPRSLSPATRFVVDHAPCPVLLVWPGTAPGIATIPAAPAAPRAGRIRSPGG
jgi:hypothetical protein